MQLVAVSYIAQLYEHFYCLYCAAVHPLACGQLGAEWRRCPSSCPAGPLPSCFPSSLLFRLRRVRVLPSFAYWRLCQICFPPPHLVMDKCHPLRFFTFGDPATSPSPPALSVRFSATSHPYGPQVLCPYPACCATRRSSLAAPECGLLLLLLPMDFHYATLCRFAWPFSSLPAPPPPGEGGGIYGARGCRG